MINSMSALASAFTILFLFWTITHLVKRFMLQKEDEYSLTQLIGIIGSGVVGALAYTFSDTFWFSAVEGEVYASSSFFTAIVFWAILKWENVADEKYANRWLILIAYLMGLSIGVHLLNLLAIPAIVLVYYFRKYTATPKGTILALILSFLFLGGIMYVIIPGVIQLGSKFELIFVNSLRLPFNSGFVFYVFLVGAALAYGIYYTKKKNKVILNTVIASVAVIVLGYSTYAMIMIRSQANPPMDENNPETVFSLMYYLNREQYGDRPLVHGQYFNAPAESTVEGKPTYTPVGKRYEITNRKLSYKFNSRFTTIFPRMYSSQPDHVQEYLSWGNIKESDVFNTRKDAQGNPLRDQEGKIVYDHSSPKKAPSFGKNIRFFFTYQIGHMYLRYFMWNFAGRQNDEQGSGEATYGNWISGINFIDSPRVGSYKNLPPEITNDPARNRYYLLPLLLGLVGLLYQAGKHSKNFWIVFVLFFMTGIAIVIYLNQYPNQPRERDYAYAGSFYAFAIWIGIGVYGLIDSLGERYKKPLTAGLISIACLVLVPGVLAKENWRDHDRSGRYLARDIAHNYLNSCAPNAILFTNGDNDTFPLWYAQEVEGIRPDVRIVNLMLLNMDWYIDQMRRKAYDSEALPISLTPDKYIIGKRDVVYIQERMTQTVDIKEIINFVSSDLPQAKLQSQGGYSFNYVPTKKFRLAVDSAKVLANGTVAQKDADKILPSIDWTFTRRNLGKSELIVLDILANNNWERPVYFVSTNHEGTLGLENYMQLEGFAYRLVPIMTPSSNQLNTGRINTDIMYENLMNKFKWGRMNEPDVYLDHFHKNTLQVVRMRQRFSRLANTLISEGKKSEAVTVMDKCIELTPDDKFPYDMFSVENAEVYYKCGENEKGDKIIRVLMEKCDNLLNYYLNQRKNIVAGSSYQIRYHLQILQNLTVVTSNFERSELSVPVDAMMKKYYDMYLK